MNLMTIELVCLNNIHHQQLHLNNQTKFFQKSLINHMYFFVWVSVDQHLLQLQLFHNFHNYLPLKLLPNFEEVAYYKLFFYKMGNTILVAQARGVLLLVLAQHNLPIVEFTPAQIKQAVAGHGNAEKLAVQEAVMRELGLEKIPRPDDAADGLAIALSAWFQC